MKKLLLVCLILLLGCDDGLIDTGAQSGVSDKETGDTLYATEFTAVKNTADTADAQATANAAAIASFTLNDIVDSDDDGTVTIGAYSTNFYITSGGYITFGDLVSGSVATFFYDHMSLTNYTIDLDDTGWDGNLLGVDADIQSVVDAVDNMSTFSDLDDMPGDDTDNDLVDQDILQQTGQDCSGAEPGSPVANRIYCSGGSDASWTVSSERQGSDDWLCHYVTASSSWKCFYNLTDGTRIDGPRCIEQVIYLQPDLIEDETDPIPALKFNSSDYPDGFTITEWSIDTDSTCTDTYGLSEYSNNGTAWTFVEAKDTITLSGISTTETTITNPDVTAGNRLFLVPPATPSDISYLTLEVCGY